MRLTKPAADHGQRRHHHRRADRHHPNRRPDHAAADRLRCRTLSCSPGNITVAWSTPTLDDHARQRLRTRQLHRRRLPAGADHPHRRAPAAPGDNVDGTYTDQFGQGLGDRPGHHADGCGRLGPADRVGHLQHRHAGKTVAITSSSPTGVYTRATSNTLSPNQPFLMFTGNITVDGIHDHAFRHRQLHQRQLRGRRIIRIQRSDEPGGRQRFHDRGGRVTDSTMTLTTSTGLNKLTTGNLKGASISKLLDTLRAHRRHELARQRLLRRPADPDHAGFGGGTPMLEKIDLITGTDAGQARPDGAHRPSGNRRSDGTVIYPLDPVPL